MKSRITTTTLIATVAVVGFAHSAEADIMMLDLDWEFYQGGYVQDPASDWAVFQGHHGGNLKQNTVAHTIGGASFESIATMDVDFVQSAGHLQLTAFNELFVTASVEPTSPQGLAHAFAALSRFFVRFVLEDHFVYTGSETLSDFDGAEFASGSVLAPGEYSFLHINPFGPPLTQTLFVGPGESDEASSTQLLAFEFTAIPAPAGLWLAAAWLLPRRRRPAGVAAR